MAVNRDCIYCGTRFLVKTNRRIFCSDKCKTRYNREERLTCFYCGDLASTRDHITPQSVCSDYGKKFAGVEVVNCCRECNALLGANFPFNMLERMNYLSRRIVNKYKLNKPIPEWSDEEIKELDGNLRKSVRAKIRERQRAIERKLNLDVRIKEYILSSK